MEKTIDIEVGNYVLIKGLGQFNRPLDTGLTIGGYGYVDEVDEDVTDHYPIVVESLTNEEDYDYYRREDLEVVTRTRALRDIDPERVQSFVKYLDLVIQDFRGLDTTVEKPKPSNVNVIITVGDHTISLSPNHVLLNELREVIREQYRIHDGIVLFDQALRGTEETE